MNTAKISEIFLSYQGEGPYASSRQLFVRFYGCDKACVFCDTKPESYKTFTKDNLMGNVLDFGDDYNELVLTGGEPLLHADFLADFLKLFKSYRKNQVYLETNGTLPEALEKVIGMVDIVAMDFKLPSSTGSEEDVWAAHENFVQIAERKELISKAVITGDTTMDDIKCMGSILKGLKSKTDVVLQPVTVENDIVKEADDEMLLYFKKYLEKETQLNVMILGQMHKHLGIR